MHRFLSIVWWLSVCSVCSVGTLRSQPANVQADPTTGVLFRPSAATFISGNNLASATGGIVLGANGGTGVANTGKTITLGGNVTTSGAFGLTLTLTAATGVTLPTTGTLATLAGSETLTNKTLTSPTLTTPTLGAATATSLTLSGNISSSAWTTSGVRLKGVAATLTDTTSTGTVAAAYTDVLGGNTIAASSATTYTDYITAFFKEPTAGSLVTMTNKWALGGESLRIGTSTPMSVSTAGAITANSLTARASTNLTLTSGLVGTNRVNIPDTLSASSSTVGALTIGNGTAATNVAIGGGNVNAGGTLTVGGVSGLGIASNVGIGLTQGGDPGTFSFTQPNAWIGGRFGPERAATTGNAFAVNGQIRLSSGTQTRGATFLADAPNGTVTNHTYFFANGAADRNAPTGSYSFYADSAAGPAYFGATTPSTGVGTGALIVAGGVGVSGAGYFGGLLNVSGSSGINIGAGFLSTASSMKWSDADASGLVWAMSPRLGDGAATNFGFYAASTLVQRWSSSGNSTIGGSLTVSGTGNSTFGGNLTIPSGYGFFLDGGGNTYLVENAADSVQVKAGGLTALTTTSALTTVNGNVTVSGTGTSTFAGAVTIAGTVIHTLSATPASASATGTVGTMSWDANYIYICTATNTWKRVAIATW